jgi:AraC-like DNA-binding protein
LSSITWSDFQPFIPFANKLHCTPNFLFGPRTIAGHQFIYVASGKGTARIQQREYEALPGDLFYYGPDVVHRFQADPITPFILYGIHFYLNSPLLDTGKHSYVQIDELKDFSYAKECRNSLFIGDSLENFFILEKINDGSKWVEWYFQSLVSEFEKAEIGSHLRNRATFIHFILKLKEHSSDSLTSVSERSRLLTDISEKLTQFADLNYNRSWLREWTNYHENHVSRMFFHHFGKSPHEFFLQAKMDLAKQLLGLSKSTIGEIAEQLHISSIHYFSKIFKERTGFRPSDYRKMRSSI